MMRTVRIVSIAALGIYLCAVTWLGWLERAGPAHEEVTLDGGLPGTLFLPEPSDGRAFLEFPARGERPPAVVLTHGFASDRLAMSSLARKLAESGYAVLTLDLQGHGQNRNPFHRSRATGDSFYGDLSAAVDYLRASPHIDGSRIVLVGHSMGASASLDYATRDSGIDGVVLISGGSHLEGPYRPSNALFVYASADPSSIRDRSRGLAASIAGVDEIEPSRTYGSISAGTAVRAVEIPGVDHLSILWSDAAASEIIAWLDAIFGVVRSPAPPPGDPRIPAVVILALAMLFVLPGLGQLVGRLVPAGPVSVADGTGRRLLVLAAALVVTLPLLSVATPAALLSVEVGDVIVGCFAVSGIALLTWTYLRDPTAISGLVRSLPKSLPGAAVAIVGSYVLILPFGVVVHRLTLTPERTLVFFVTALALLPFALAFQLLTRRGRLSVATSTALGGRVLELVVLYAGTKIGVVPGVVVLMLPALAFVLLPFEVLAASIYAASRNLTAISWIEAAWVGLFVAAIMPVRV